MKTINVTDCAFEEFKKLKITLQALLKEEMSDSTALAEMFERLKASKMITIEA